MDLITLLPPSLLGAGLAVIGWMVRSHLSRINALESELGIVTSKLEILISYDGSGKIKNLEADMRVQDTKLNEHLVTVTRDAATVKSTLDGIKEQLNYQLHHIDEKLDRVIEREIERDKE